MQILQPHSLYKCYDNKFVMLFRIYLEEITTKLYNWKMGGVDSMDQLKSPHQLDQKRSFDFISVPFSVCSMLLLSFRL